MLFTKGYFVPSLVDETGTDRVLEEIIRWKVYRETDSQQMTGNQKSSPELSFSSGELNITACWFWRSPIFGCKLYALCDIFINNAALCSRSFKAFCITAWDIFYIPSQHKYKAANTAIWIGANYTLQNTPVHSTAQRQWQQKWILWWYLWSQKCVSHKDNLNPAKEETCNK